MSFDAVFRNTLTPLSFLVRSEAVYGDKKKVMTALATYPIAPEERVGILDYLPLWYRPETAENK